VRRLISIYIATPPLTIYTLFPYTTLFRSVVPKHNRYFYVYKVAQTEPPRRDRKRSDEPHSTVLFYRPVLFRLQQVLLPKNATIQVSDVLHCQDRKFRLMPAP